MKDNFKFVFQVDKVLNEDEEFILDGWAFNLEEEATEGAMELWLYDLQEEKIAYPKKTDYTKRSDVNRYFICEYNYIDCGIIASFDKDELLITGKDYEVLVADIKNAKVYQTGTYISNGELMYCLPEEYKELEVAGTSIEKIVKDGVLRVYSPDVGMYVYQYEEYLYWIADTTCKFIDKDSTFIDYMLQTTQPQLLPEHRKQYGNDNLDFIFQNSEFIESNGYKVAKKKIPSEYSISYILTGHREDSEWVWRNNFRIYYSFSKENE